MPIVEVSILGPKGMMRTIRLDSEENVARLLGKIASEFGLSPNGHYSLRTENARTLPNNTTLAAYADERLVLHMEPSDKPISRLNRMLGRRSAVAHTTELAGYRVLPCYLVIDVSSSMAGKPIEDINRELPLLFNKMQVEPQLTEVCHLGIITFDSDARVRSALQEIQIARPINFKATVPSTNYAAAFRLLRNEIAADLYRLLDEGRRPYIPAVFFLSDGQPNTEDWQKAFEMLTESAFYGAPNIVAFGFGTATESTIRHVGLRAAYMQDEGTPSVKLDEFMTFLLTSLTRSIKHNRDQRGDDILEIPATPPPGWRTLNLDDTAV